LSEALYNSDHVLNQDVAREFRLVHHLKEDISFYLSDLLATISPEQIYAIMTTEALDHDMKSCLGIENVKKKHSHGDKTPREQLNLTETAKENLRMFLQKDYAAIEKLHTWGNLEDDIFKKLIA